MNAPLADKSEDLALLRDFSERGNRAALGELFSRHADAAYRFALRLSGRPADAEDVLQTAFLEVFRHAAQFRGESSVKSWILGFVLNASRSRAREESRRKARQDRAAAQSASAPEAVSAELADQVRQAVEGLPEHYRSPVWLHYAEGLSAAEVAAALNLPAETVRKQLSRGIDRLRETLVPTGAATGLIAVLATLAVETAPPSVATSLASIAAGAAPAVKAGLGSMISATAVAAIAIASTAGFLWWGIRTDDGRPPDLAEIERRVREWQPTPEERRFDEIGWAPDLRSALRHSRASGRPVFLLTQSGRIHLGRSDGGSQFLRSRALSDAGTISLLNGCFVPVYLSNADFDDVESADPEEKSLRDAVWADARKAKLPSGMDCLFLLDPGSSHVAGTFDLGKATPEALKSWLEANRKTPPGPPLVKPRPQSVPPLALGGALVLHLTARYLDAEGRVEKERPDFHEVPGEDWIRLGPEEWKTLLPPAGASIAVDPALAERLLTHFHPSDMSIDLDPNRRNRFEEAVLRATRYSPSFVRIEGRLRMTRSFTQVAKTPELPVTASVRGYLEIEPDGSRIRSLLLITDHATYGSHSFGVALRSVP